MKLFKYFFLFLCGAGSLSARIDHQKFINDYSQYKNHSHNLKERNIYSFLKDRSNSIKNVDEAKILVSAITCGLSTKTKGYYAIKKESMKESQKKTILKVLENCGNFLAKELKLTTFESFMNTVIDNWCDYFKEGTSYLLKNYGYVETLHTHQSIALQHLWKSALDSKKIRPNNSFFKPTHNQTPLALSLFNQRAGHIVLMLKEAKDTKIFNANKSSHFKEFSSLNKALEIISEQKEESDIIDFINVESHVEISKGSINYNVSGEKAHKALPEFTEISEAKGSLALLHNFIKSQKTTPHGSVIKFDDNQKNFRVWGTVMHARPSNVIVVTQQKDFNSKEALKSMQLKLQNGRTLTFFISQIKNPLERLEEKSELELSVPNIFNEFGLMFSILSRCDRTGNSVKKIINTASFSYLFCSLKEDFYVKTENFK